MAKRLLSIRKSIDVFSSFTYEWQGIAGKKRLRTNECCLNRKLVPGQEERAELLNVDR